MKIFKEFFNKDIWISSLIAGIFWAIFVFGGGFIAFGLKIDPWWIKLILLAVLGIALYAVRRGRS